MAVSPRRVSKSRKRMKNSHSALKIPGLTICKNCSTYKKPHIVCVCGYYNGKKILNN